MAALSEVEKLEARYAENPDGRYFAPLADAYRKAGRVDDAIQVVTAGLTKHPDYLSAHIVLGRCFLEKKDDNSALGAFQRVLGLDAENIIALKALAEISERTGDTEAARRWLQRLINVDAMNSEAAEDLARLGGPLEEAAPAEEAQAPQAFMDLGEPEEKLIETPMVAPEPEPAPVPRTLERPAVKWPPPAPEPTPEPAPVAEAPRESLPMLDLEPSAAAPPADTHEPAAPLELEHTSFQPPASDVAPAAADIVPFDDQLAWGAGERTSRAVSADDIAAAEAKHEATASAIEFMGAEPAPGRSSEAGPPPAAVSAYIDGEASGPVDPNMSTLPIESVAPPPGWAASPPSGQAATIEMSPIRIPGHEEPVPSATAEEPPSDDVTETAEPEQVTAANTSMAHAETNLPLIMPEDVTPADEMRRPSSKLVQMVSPEPADVPADGGEAMVTETMGDLYLRQGFKDQAADVYRRLLALRPDDAGLKAKLAAILSPPAMSATALGQEAVGTWLKRIAKAQLGAPAAAAPPAPPEPGMTPMEQAFSAPEPEATPAPAAVQVPDEANPAGKPARPATDQFSLDQLFGSSGAHPAPQRASGKAPPTGASGSHTLGSSFDEFFGSAPQQETVRPKEGTPGGRQSEDDLSAFNAWLHGLKR